MPLVAFVSALVTALVLLVATTTRTAWADAPWGPDRTTPRRAVAAFLDAADAGDWARAAEGLDLQAIPVAQRGTKGAELARMLDVILERAAWLDLAQLSDEPKGKVDDGDSTEIVTLAKLRGRDQPISLSRTAPGVGPEREWLVSASTVARIPKLYEEHGPGAIERRMPEALKGGKWTGLAVWQWIGLAIGLGLAALVAVATAYVLLAILRRIAARTKAQWDDELVASMRGPTRLFLGSLAFGVILTVLSLPAAAIVISNRFVAIGGIASIAWLAMRTVVVIANAVERRARRRAEMAGDAELRARAVATQVRVLRRVVNVALGIIAVALMLMQWEIVRNIGVSLLASAGIAGIVLGFAAQRTIGSLIAGIQLSATQPVRIGDTVIIEKEYGTIEEVTLTYVVVKIWDERRLIVPMSRFLDQPFENWTKTSSTLHGTIFLSVDWWLPVDAMRAELDRILEDEPLWDRRTKNIQVTDAKGSTLEVRALVSAANASNLGDLRVKVRERLVRWLQTFEGGRYVPVVRYELRAVADGPEGAIRKTHPKP
jgi:small-conductance mechanosensitive channel